MPEPPPHDPAAMVRVQFLVRIESLVNVGCHFGPDDLPPAVWDELIAYAIERAYIERILDQRRERHSEEQSVANEARTATGAPPPGGTIFPTSRPFR